MIIQSVSSIRLALPSTRKLIWGFLWSSRRNQEGIISMRFNVQITWCLNLLLTSNKLLSCVQCIKICLIYYQFHEKHYRPPHVQSPWVTCGESKSKIIINHKVQQYATKGLITAFPGIGLFQIMFSSFLLKSPVLDHISGKKIQLGF